MPPVRRRPLPAARSTPSRPRLESGAEPTDRAVRAVGLVGLFALVVFGVVVAVAVVPTFRGDAAGSPGGPGPGLSTSAAPASPPTSTVPVADVGTRPAAPAASGAAPRLGPPSPSTAPAPRSRSGAGPPPDDVALGDPVADVAPSPDFLTACAGDRYDDSVGCVDASVAAIDHARRTEGLGPMILPGDWYRLSPEQQLFVATNLERTSRGLPAAQGLADALDQAAAAGAGSGADPAPPQGFVRGLWDSNWGAAVGNPLEVVYLWMYDDGPDGYNLDCSAQTPSGCWDHRNNVLAAFSSASFYMGAGYVASAYQGTPAWAEILVSAAGNPPVVFSWSQVFPPGSP